MPLLLLIISLLFKCILWSHASPIQQQAWRSLPGASFPHSHLHTHLHSHLHTCLHTCPHTCLHPALDRAALGPLTLHVRQSEGLQALGLVLVILDMNSIKT